MAFNGSGVYSPPAASFPAVTGTVIDSTKYNAVINDIASGLTGVITKDGQTTITANLPMATYRHTGVSNGAALDQYATADQVIDNALTHASTSAVGTDAYAVSLTISPGAYAAKQRYQFLTDVPSTGACTVDFNGLGAKSIKLADGNDPFTNAILAAAVVDVVYDGTNFILLNPYLDFNAVTGTVTATHTELNILDGATLDVTELNYVDGVTSDIQTQINSVEAMQSITGTVAASALTAGLNAGFLSFRNATLGTGTATELIFSALSLVVPSTATLGTVSTIQSRLILLAINNAGTVELAIVNLSGGNNLDESTLITTTAIDATADSDNVIYSTTARTSVAFRVVGFIESTQATAGTWATTPSTLQPYNGSYLSSMGFGQTRQELSGSRSVGTTYYNLTGRSIFIEITAANDTAGGGMGVSIDSATVTNSGGPYANNQGVHLSFMVMPGSTYVISAPNGGTLTIGTWYESR